MTNNTQNILIARMDAQEAARDLAGYEYTQEDWNAAYEQLELEAEGESDLYTKKTWRKSPFEYDGSDDEHKVIELMRDDGVVSYMEVSNAPMVWSKRKWNTKIVSFEQSLLNFQAKRVAVA